MFQKFIIYTPSRKKRKLNDEDSKIAYNSQYVDKAFALSYKLNLSTKAIKNMHEFI